MHVSLDLPTLSLFFVCILSTYLTTLAWTPPNPPPRSPYGNDRLGLIVPIQPGLRLFRFFNTLFSSFHYFLILVYPSPPKIICPNATNLSPSLFTWSPYSILCLTTIIFFCAIRLLAFKQLGTDFTFQLAKPSGLNTSGMYAHVQHPSYTAMFLLSVGNAMFLLRVDGMVACFLPGWVVRQAWWVNWVLLGLNIGMGTWGTAVRVKAEEEMLRRTFGGEWEGWHKKTKRFVPGLF
jgi:protein-S-isoprenylcysteine O-methyltransferase Ste14